MSRTITSRRLAAKTTPAKVKPTAKASAKSTPAKAAKKSTKKAAVAGEEDLGPAPKFVIELDERTAGLTAQALACRETNHIWATVSQGHALRALLAHRGQFEKVRTCQTCGSQKSDLYWLPSFERVRAPRYTWSEGYLIAKEFAGRGRLSKADILREQFVRENLDLVA